MTRNVGFKKAAKNPLNKQKLKAAISKSKRSEAQSMSEFSDFSDEETNKEVTPPTSPLKGKSAKLFESTIGRLKKTQKLRSGDLLVETASPQQSAKLLAAKKLGDIEVTVTPHGSLNSSRGVISEDELDIQMNLKDQCVTAVRRISIRRDGKLIPTKHLIFTFNMLILPTSITAGHLRCPVCLYIPNPLRCSKCQRFGHSQTSCRGHICAQCGVEGHQSTECTTTPCSVNCKDTHPAYSCKCPAWQTEKEI
ncbi:uncharacterized protein LOC111633447 [Centruroides sculpturatus]|uniref:uncharacterized protein LOC111633447 n=1 Tax=Centruroides sculpturatus TaxID=218467 RepID=UPI000C6E9C72|nr:uncharacterized protein LOC111633447 [Centruroides sculpturatus]